MSDAHVLRNEVLTNTIPVLDSSYMLYYTTTTTDIFAPQATGKIVHDYMHPKPPNKHYLETVTGTTVDVENPTEDMINIQDIAWGLSRIPRFAGHTITKVPYSVAQHSIMVMRYIRDNFEDSSSEILMQALLHDAAEVYIGDIPSPIKKLPSIRESIKTIENRLMLSIYSKFNLCIPTPEGEALIKKSDLRARAIEAHNFMVSRGKTWNLPEVDLLTLQSFEPPMIAQDAYKLFMEEFKELQEYV